jgi:hypothetical protein
VVNLANWPVRQRIEAARDAISDDYDAVPIPAYNPDGDLAPPHLYERILAGATAEVHFGLRHHFVKKGQTMRSSFVAYLHKLMVLKIPVSVLHVPKTPSPKKKLARAPRTTTNRAPRKKNMGSSASLSLRAHVLTFPLRCCHLNEQVLPQTP